MEKLEHNNMNKYSKHNDIEKILARSDSLLQKIQNEYSNSIYSEIVSDDLTIDIRDLVGYFRSALDFAMKKVSNNNFPIRDTKKDFDSLKLNLSDGIKNIIEKYQPYNGVSWIKYINILNNELKHVTLLPQKRHETIQKVVSHPSGGSVSWGSGVTFGSGVRIMGVPIDPTTQMPVPNNIVKTEVIKWIGFTFDNSNMKDLPDGIVVLPLLKESFEGVVGIIKELDPLI